MQIRSHPCRTCRLFWLHPSLSKPACTNRHPVNAWQRRQLPFRMERGLAGLCVQRGFAYLSMWLSKQLSPFVPLSPCQSSRSVSCCSFPQHSRAVSGLNMALKSASMKSSALGCLGVGGFRQDSPQTMGHPKVMLFAQCHQSATALPCLVYHHYSQPTYFPSPGCTASSSCREFMNRSVL